MAEPNLPSSRAADAHGQGGLANVDLPNLPPADRPPGAEQAAVWDIVREALNMAPRMVREAGKDPQEWFWILAAALNVVVNTRERDAANAGTRADSPSQLTLAYADHYLQMRADAFNLGPASTQVLKNAVLNYDLLKVRGLIFRTGKGGVSPATHYSVYWGMKGIADGFEDRTTHAVAAGTQNVTLAVNEMARFTAQATLLAIQAYFHAHPWR